MNSRNRSAQSWLAAAFAALFVMFAQTAKAAGVAEQRCLDLGANCACSEPLDFSGSIVPTGGGFDPPDTEGGGAKECNAGMALLTSKTHGTVTAASVGLNGPSYVMQAILPDLGKVMDGKRTITSKTYCSRHYLRFSSGLFAPANNSDPANIKGPRNEKPRGAANPGVETEWIGSPAKLRIAPGHQDSAFGNPGNLGTSGGAVSFGDCKAGWCRVEICYDHNAFGGNKLNIRGRVVSLLTGAVQNHGPKLTPNSSGSANSGDVNNIAVWSMPGYGPAGEYVYFSHAMVAVTPKDSSFWIGPAAEIEGSTGPPPPPAAPEAPILLSD